MKAAELFVRCLENEGVEYVFGLPGEEIAELLKALSGSKIKFVLSRHEQGASFMADVYGRLTGKAGVCLSTLGPGATNLLTGVADAYLDRAPVVAITGQGALERTYEESHQYIDIVSAYKFLTKWNRSLTRAKFIPQVVRKAFSLAESEKTGATHIELPEDVAAEEIDLKDVLPLERMQHESPSVVGVEGSVKAISLIKNSECPIILAGNGVIRAGASQELRDFARVLNIPVANTFMGKGVVSSRDELSIGTIGMPAKDLINCVFDQSDLVIAVGYDFVEYGPKRWNNVNEETRSILHIDSAPPETDPNYSTTMALVGNIRATLRLLVEEARRANIEKKQPTYARRIRSMIDEELSRYASDDAFPIKPQRIINEIRSVLDDEDILISDVGMHKLWIARLYPAYSPNTVIISNGFASMGISLPGAIAAKLAKPERRVVAVCGDGGFMMNLYELATARRLGLGFTLLIFEDSAYSQIEWKQMAKFGASYFVKFTNPDLEKLAESFGAKAKRVQNVADFKETLARAVNSEELWVIVVPVNVKENELLSGRIGENLECPAK